MGGRHLPQSYVETGRFGVKQATPADILLAIVVGLSVPIALLILGRPPGRARRLGCDHRRRDIHIEVQAGGVGSTTSEPCFGCLGLWCRTTYLPVGTSGVARMSRISVAL